MTSIVFFDIKDYELEYFKNSQILQQNEVLFFEEPVLSVKKIPEKSLDAKVISVFTPSRLTAEVLAEFKNLALIITRSVGYSHIDVDYCKNNGIKIVTTTHYGDCTVAEFAFGLLLDLVRKISIAASDVRNADVKKYYTGVELFGKTIGIVGIGAIGRQSVRIAKGFGMNILAVDIFPDKTLEKDFDVKYTNIEDLCRNADFILLHSPLTKDNYHLFDKDKFDMMKKSAVIVNTARGELIDTKALYEALINDKIAGAALDVIECEEYFSCESNLLCDETGSCADCVKKTLLNHVIVNLKNVIITPHIAYDTSDATNRILQKTVLNLEKFLQNQPMPDELSLHK